MQVESDRPNVLVIVTDQQRADHVGFAGNTTVATPHLDALAARARVFDRAYVANPVCSPNRSSLLTGRMPSSHGVIFNERALEWGTNTFVRSLRHAGYRTGLIGKSHLQLSVDRWAVPDIGRDARTDGYADDVYTWEFAERYDTVDPPASPEDYYGFEHVEFSTDHGARMAGHHLRWALAKGAAREDVFPPMSPDAPGDRRSERWWQIYRPPYEPELHSTAFVGERTRAFIDDAHRSGRPWMAWMAFPDPHHPLTPPGHWFDRHDPRDIPLPPSFGDPLDDAPPYVQAIRRREEAPFWVLPFGTDDPVLVQEAIAATYGMIEFIDDEIGRVLAQLETLGIADDTLVVFTSDHGDAMGDHSLMVKGNIHYDGVIRVPFCVAGPGVAPGRSTALVSSLDLAPTVLDICGAAPYRGIQGESLATALAGDDGPARDHLLIEDDLQPEVAGLLGNPSRMRTLITDEVRFTRDDLGFEQLFDRTVDPHEMEDRSTSDPRRGDLVTAMVDAMMAVDDLGGGVGRGRSG